MSTNETRRVVDSSTRLHSAIHLAAEVVMAKWFVDTYQTAQMLPMHDGVKSLSSAFSQIGAAIGDKDLIGSELMARRNMQHVEKMLDVTPAQWEAGFQSIGRKRKTIELLDRACAIARPGLAAASADLSDLQLFVVGGREIPSECSAAYRRAREHLISTPHSPRWLALVLLALGCAIASNTRSSFASNEWHDGTFFWFRLESAWLQGDGKLVGKMLLDGDKQFFSNRIDANLGTSMAKRLAEAACLAPDWALFHSPW